MSIIRKILMTGFVLAAAVVFVIYSVSANSTAAAYDTVVVVLDGRPENHRVYKSGEQVYFNLQDIVQAAGGSVRLDNRQSGVIVQIGGRTVPVDTEPAERYREWMNLGGVPRRILVRPSFFADYLGMGLGYMNGMYFLSARPADRIPALLYHHILPDEVNVVMRENPWTISTENFEEQMRYLYENRFYTPTLDEIEAFVLYGRLLPYNSVQIHFDDGYYSNYVYAYPILRRYGLRAVIFPITAEALAVGEGQPPIDHDSLTVASVSTLWTGKDVFETASHSHDLHAIVPGTNMSTLVAATIEEIIYDTLRSLEFVSHIRAYAYPFGQHSEHVVKALQEAGITIAFATHHGFLTKGYDPMRLPRFSVYRETRMERFAAIVNRSD